MVALASEPAAAQFVLGRMADEPARTDQLIVKVIVFEPYWVDEPGVTESLRRLAESTTGSRPDAALPGRGAAPRGEAPSKDPDRADRRGAPQIGDAKTLETLAQADERWIMTERGATIPGFMRKPPAVFSVKALDQPVRVVGMGDFGSGSQEQRNVAAAIVRMGGANPFDFGLTFGDNFYPSGMTGIGRSALEGLVGDALRPLGITFYPTLGNHEWYSDDGAAAEIAYHSPTWRFPVALLLVHCGSGAVLRRRHDRDFRGRGHLARQGDRGEHARSGRSSTATTRSSPRKRTRRTGPT